MLPSAACCGVNVLTHPAKGFFSRGSGKVCVSLCALGIIQCPMGSPGPDPARGTLSCPSLLFFSPTGCPREREEEHEG